jgi:3-methyladenine DNA glycosylase AlkD
MKWEEILAELASHGDERNRAGMARYGITVDDAYGVSMPIIRGIGKSIGKDHQLASDLWRTGNHEARILATIVDVPALVTEEQMEEWVLGFNSWDVCDQCCSNLFSRAKFAVKKAREWSGREEEYVRRAGFVLMAALAVHDKRSADDLFIEFLGIIDSEYANDERAFVKKAVNWALRQIGKRNMNLREEAIKTAESVRAKGTKSARWIANDALRELMSEKTTTMIRNRKTRRPS